MNVFRKATYGAVGLALTLGGLTTVTTVAADAAAPCAAENQAAGAAHNDAQHKAATYRQKQRKLKKAKRAYRKHHTKANRKKVRKARKAAKKAYARYRTSYSRYAQAKSRADHCSAPTTPTPTPAPAAPVPGDVTYYFNQIFGPLSQAGLPVDQIRALAEQLAQALPAPGQLDPGVLTGAIDQLVTALEGAGVPAGDVAQPLEDLLAALAGGQVDPTRFQALVQQLVTALQGLAPTGGDNPLTPAVLIDLLHQISDPLTQAGLPANTIVDAIAQGLAQIPTDPSQIPSDPQGLIDLVLTGVEHALAGTPLAQLNPLLEQIRTGLNDLLGGLLNGL